MNTFAPYLMFGGNCAEAMRFYESALGGKIEAMLTYGESPSQENLVDADREKIMHARLLLDGHTLMASDCASCYPYEGKKGISLTLAYPSVDAARKVFDALAEGGKIMMPMNKTFWAESFGMLVDRYDTAWMINGGEMYS